MARGDSLERQWRLMQLLEERREVSIPEIARELGAAVRTLYRDMVVLERVGVPIYPERRGARSRWRVLDGYRRKLSITLSWPEMVALTVGRDLLAGSSGATFHESALSALAKIRSALPSELVKRAEALGNGVSAVGGPERTVSRARETITELIDAIDRQETVRVKYRPPRQKAAHERTVDPHHLLFQAGAVYLIGYVHEHQALRTYLVDRITEISRAGTRFERRKDFKAQDFMQGALGPWSGRAMQVQLRFSAEAAPYVSELKVHPSQVNQLRADGSLDVRLLAPLSPQLTRWLMGFGEDVSVIAPKALAERLREAHHRAANQSP